MKLNILTVVALLAGSVLSLAAEYGYLSFTKTTPDYVIDYDDETITLNAGDRIEFTASSDFFSNIQLTLPDSSSTNLPLGTLVGSSYNGALTRAQIVGPCVLQMSNSNPAVDYVTYASYKITRAGTENSSSYITVPSNPSGNFELKLQTSTDLETWSSTTPGVFPYGDNAKFFRLVMETP